MASADEIQAMLATMMQHERERNDTQLQQVYARLDQVLPQQINGAARAAVSQATSQQPQAQGPVNQNPLDEVLRSMNHLIQIQTQQQQAFADFMTNGPPHGPRGGHRGVLEHKDWSLVTKFDGTESTWVEWNRKFMAVVEQCSPEIANVLTWAAMHDTEINEDDVIFTALGQDPNDPAVVERLVRVEGALKGKLTSLLSASAFQILEALEGRSMFEVWRQLHRRYNPKSAIRATKLMTSVLGPAKLKKGEDPQIVLTKWESRVLMLERDYKEKLSEMMKVGVLIRMLPDDLQESMLKQADKINTYRAAKEQLIVIMDSRQQLRDADRMDVGAVDKDDGAAWYEDEQGSWWRQMAESEERADDVVAVDAVGKGVQCHRCKGFGHVMAQCPSPASPALTTPKGGGKAGKGSIKGKGKGKGVDGKGVGVCYHCGKPGHRMADCWTLHPEKRAAKQMANVEETVALGSVDATMPRYVAPNMPEFFSKNPFSDLVNAEGDAVWGIASVEVQSQDGEREESGLGNWETWEKEDISSVEVLGPAVGSVDRGPTKKVQMLETAGRGTITVDSGAAESCLPVSAVPKESLREGAAKKAGVRYQAACGTSMDNKGEKNVRFRTIDAKGQRNKLSSILFQVTDVGKPLASVSRMLDAGNTVVFTRSGAGPRIVNDKTGDSIPMREVNRTFVLDVEFLQPKEDCESSQQQQQPFARQAS